MATTHARKYTYNLHSGNKLQELQSSFLSPKRTSQLHDGMEDTPSPNKNSNSPFSTLKRHTNTIKHWQSYDFWRRAARLLYVFRENGIRVIVNGEIDNEMWSEHWRNIKRLPHNGLMNLNVYQFFGGSFAMWATLQKNYYNAPKYIIDLLAQGEKTYRKEYSAKYAKFGSQQYVYGRMSSEKKKVKTRKRAPLPPSDTDPIALPPSKKQKRSETESDIPYQIQRESIDEYQLQNVIRQSRAHKQSFEQSQFDDAIRESRLSLAKYVQEQSAFEARIRQAMTHSHHSNNTHLRNGGMRYGLNESNNSHNKNRRSITPFGAQPTIDENLMHKSDFALFSQFDYDGRAGQFINYHKSDGLGGTILDRNCNENDLETSGIEAKQTMKKSVTDTKHPLCQLNEENDFKPKPSAKGFVNKEKTVKVKSERKRKTVVPLDQSTVRIGQSIVSISEGKAFKKLQFKHKSVIGVGIINELYESNDKFSSFGMGNRDDVRAVLVKVGGGKASQYNIVGFLSDYRIMNVCADDIVERFLKEGKEREGYFCDNIIRDKIDSVFVNGNVNQYCQSLMKSIEDAMVEVMNDV